MLCFVSFFYPPISFDADAKFPLMLPAVAFDTLNFLVPFLILLAAFAAGRTEVAVCAISAGTISPYWTKVGTVVHIAILLKHTHLRIFFGFDLRDSDFRPGVVLVPMAPATIVGSDDAIVIVSYDPGMHQQIIHRLQEVG